MTGKIFGIPLALIVLVLFIAFLVNLPMFLFYRQTYNKLSVMDLKLNELNATLKAKPSVIPTVTPIVEEEEEATPSPTIRRLPSATPTQTE